MRVNDRGHPEITLLPPSWEPTTELPVGVIVAPARDPDTAARRLAEMVGGQLLTNLGEAERALTRAAASERSRRLLDEAAEATRLATELEGADAVADRRLMAQGPELARQVEAGRTARARVEDARAIAAARDAAMAAEASLAAAAGRALEASAALDSCPLASVEEAHARAAADAVVDATALATAAQAALGPRPDPGEATFAASEAHAVVADAEDALALAERRRAARRGRLFGATVAAVGLALAVGGAGLLPPTAAALVPGAVVLPAAILGRRQRVTRRHATVALQRACTARDQAAERYAEVELELADWQRRLERVRAADADLIAALAAWVAVAGPGADAERVDELLVAGALMRATARDLAATTTAHVRAQARVAEITAAWEGLASSVGLPPETTAIELLEELDRRQAVAAEAEARLRGLPEAEARCRARARLHEVLHGRRLDRLQEEAAHLAAPPDGPARTLVLVEPFAGIGGGRRRAFLRELERAALQAPVAVITADQEALAWAAAHRQPEGSEAPSTS